MSDKDNYPSENNPAPLHFDYFYNNEALQFTFIRIPKLILDDPMFLGISNEAKLLYGIMLDRCSLSIENQWFDDLGRAYIIFTIDNVKETLHVAQQKACKLIAELRDFGLIEVVKKGQGSPSIIYVKSFCSNAKSRNLKIKFQEVPKSNFKKFENQISRNLENEFLEIPKSNSNNTNINNTENNDTDSINQSMDTIDETTIYTKIVKDNVRYQDAERCLSKSDFELFDELTNLIIDIVCVKREKIRINGEDYPYSLVKSNYLKLQYDHLLYVIEEMGKNTVKISNMRAYLITALFNAPSTMNSHYQAEANHDMYNGKDNPPLL